MSSGPEPFWQWIQKIMALVKARITILVAVTTVTGYLMAQQAFTVALLAATVGTFLLSCGASALNEYQERHLDALMLRTQKRPLPSGAISSGSALAIAIAISLLGLIILWLGTNSTAALLGLLALFWYNAVYTPLKRKTAFAVIPGALIGAIPPVIGFVSAGGALTDSKILILALFFFVWQIPHFWLLVIIHGQDYRRAGLPSLTQIFSPQQLSRMTSLWMIATAMTCFLLPIFNVVQWPGINLALIVASFWLVWKALGLFLPVKNKPVAGNAFKFINIYALVVILLIVLEKFFAG